MTATLDMFTQDEFRGNIGKLPVCQLLNSESRPGLFVKEKDAKLAGWNDGIVGEYDKYTHQYRDKEKTKESGFFFSSPKLHILSVSPRLVEVTKKGAELGLGKIGAILQSYENEIGQYIHHNPETKGGTSLRTFYLIQLLDSKGEFIHSLPLVLSVKGAAAATFGKAWDAFGKLAESAYTKNYSSDGEYLTLNEQAKACLIFNPKFTGELVGEENQSFVCVVESFAEPSSKSKAELERSFNMPKYGRIQGTRKSFAAFADRILKQLEEFHPINGNLNLLDEPQPIKSALPPGEVDY
jgi:hypothetical protein